MAYLEEQIYICYYVCSRPKPGDPGMFQEFLLGYHYLINEFHFYLWEGNLKRGRGEYILKLDFIPKNITPDNIEEKIQTLLTFS